MDELYKQEVLELTELLKNDEEWEDLRNIKNIKKGKSHYKSSIPF